jgi:hypothetical protein
MDPFARKMVFGALAFGGVMVVMAGALSVVYFHQRPRCTDQVFADSPSPNRQWTAAVMLRRCGEDSPFLAHVNVRPAADPVRLGYFSGAATEGEVFVAEQEAPDAVPGVEWTPPTTLIIRCTKCKAAQLRKREDHIGAIAIRYELQP